MVDYPVVKSGAQGCLSVSDNRASHSLTGLWSDCRQTRNYCLVNIARKAELGCIQWQAKSVPAPAPVAAFRCIQQLGYPGSLSQTGGIFGGLAYNPNLKHVRPVLRCPNSKTTGRPLLRAQGLVGIDRCGTARGHVRRNQRCCTEHQHHAKHRGSITGAGRKQHGA